MNQYECYLCKNQDDCIEVKSQAVRDVSIRCGLTCHSDFQRQDKVLEDLEKDMHEHYDFVAAQYNIQGGAYYRGRKELYEQIFEKLVELQCSKREGQG
jgi:hypothetical protein